MRVKPEEDLLIVLQENCAKKSPRFMSHLIAEHFQSNALFELSHSASVLASDFYQKMSSMKLLQADQLLTEPETRNSNERIQFIYSNNARKKYNPTCHLY